MTQEHEHSEQGRIAVLDVGATMEAMADTVDRIDQDIVRMATALESGRDKSSHFEASLICAMGTIDGHLRLANAALIRASIMIRRRRELVERKLSDEAKGGGS